MPDHVTKQQVQFEGALNAVAAPQVLGPTEVQASTNVDFSLEPQAASVRRGSKLFAAPPVVGTHTSNAQVTMITRNYGLSTGVFADDTMVPFFAETALGQHFVTDFPLGNLAVVQNSAGVPVVPGGTQSQVLPSYTAYNGYLYIANGTSAFKTTGNVSMTFDWLLPQPDQPSVVLTPQFAASIPFIGFAGTAGTATYTATEGTITSTSTNAAYFSTPTILATCNSGTGTRIVVVGACSTTNWENPIVFVTAPSGTLVTTGAGTFTLGGNIDFHQGWPSGDTTGASGSYVGTMTTTQTMTAGVYGTDYLLLALANQQNVVTIQRDLSLGDATFTNYWHQETTALGIDDATLDPVSAFITSQGNSISANQTIALNTNRGNLSHIGANTAINVPVIRKSISKTSISASVSPWAVSRSDYKFIGAFSAPDFSNVQAVRVIIEFNTPGQVAVIGGFATYGGLGYPLNDQASGISYYQTLARVENGFIISEGAPSLPSPPAKCQFAHAAITVGTMTNTTAGVTHRVFYRTGGLLQDAYRLGSVALANSTNNACTIYDYAFPDMNIITNPVMTRNLWSQWPDPSAGTGLPGVNAISQVWQSRAWIGVQNQLYWTIPGQLSKVQNDSQTSVSDVGDSISAIIPSQNLVVVNQNSVFEMAGTIFEGPYQNWTLTRTQSRRGSAAPRTAINTPQGILLLGYDGLSMYRQGYGMDEDLGWVYDRIGDLWKGTAFNDPAALKGRIPALNGQAIFNSCAAYKDGKIYLAVPTGINTLADTMFVLDLMHQRVWMFTYPFSICSLFWDRMQNRLFAGDAHGSIRQLEVGLADDTTPITWSFTTREWSAPMDLQLENLQTEALGSGTWQVDINNTNTQLLGTWSKPVKVWTPAPLLGSVGENINYIYSGTQSGLRNVVYGLEWDAIPQAPQITFYETNPIAPPSETYVKTWLVDVNALGAIIQGTLLVDGTVVLQTAITNGAAGDLMKRRVYEVGLPNVTAGKNITAIYNASIGGSFRHYDTQFEFEPKPFGKTTWLVTYKKAGGVTQADMARFYAMDIEGLSTNTITNTWIIDGAVFSTNVLVLGATDAGEEGLAVRNYMDQIPFPPGARGYLFQQQMTAATPFKVWRASMDIERIGVKGLSRVTQNGTPSGGSNG